ncbi:MAG: aminotransferase class I/II-fold pyridoxal phosphate-dependent enzyme [Gemmataceae bacterium]
MQNEPNTSQSPFKIEVADRVKRLPPYLFAKINALKYQKRRQGIDVIDLGMGNPSDVPDPQVIEKMVEAVRDERNHGYSVANGLRNLRKEVAIRYEKRFGVHLDPDTEVIAGLGSKEVFSHMCLALMGPGDTAVVPAPSFPIHVYAVMLASGNVISLDCTNPQNFLSQVSLVAEQLYPKLKVLILNYPHNPTTTIVDQDFFKDVVALAKKHSFMVIHDFAYGDVCFDGYKAPSFLSVPGAKEVGVETTTMSKGYNMAWWRLGFCAGNQEMVRALATITGYYDYGIFAAIQIAGIVALRHCDDLVQNQALIYQKRRDVLVDGLNRMGWETIPPKATMFVWTRYPKEWRDRMGSIDFSMKLMEEAEVAVSPGRAFGELGEGYLRLALVENEQRMRQALRNIARCLKSDIDQVQANAG